MAKAVINLQKESGGIVKISPVDGIGITEVTVPESGELVTKEYADLKVALSSFIGTNQSLSVSGYQKLPGGLIIQWGGSELSPSNGTPITFPITFPNAIFRVISGVNAFGTGVITLGINTTTTSGFNTYVSGSNPGAYVIEYIAIGY